MTQDILVSRLGILRTCVLGLAIALCLAPSACESQPRAKKQTTVEAIIRVERGKADDVQMEAARIKLRSVLRKALQQPAVAQLQTVQEHKQALEWVEDYLQVQWSEDSELIFLTMKGPRPNELAVLIDAVVDSYLPKAREAEQSHYPRQREDELQRHRNENLKIIRSKLEHLQQQIQKSEGQNKLQNLKQQEALDDFRDAKRVFHDATMKLTRAKRMLELEKQRATKSSKNIESKTTSDLPNYLIAEELERDSNAQQLRKKIGELKNLIEGYRNVSNDKSKIAQGTLKGFEADLQRTQLALKKREEELVQAIRQKLTADPQTAKSQKRTIEELTDQVKILEEEEKDAQTRYDQALKETQRFYGKSTADVEATLKEIDRRHEIARAFEIAIEELRSIQPHVVVLQRAKPR